MGECNILYVYVDNFFQYHGTADWDVSIISRAIVAILRFNALDIVLESHIALAAWLFFPQ